MAKNDLLKEAIADAKAVRETALANAKIALEEAFTPRIQSMLSAKLSEEEEMEGEVSEEETMEEPASEEGRGDKEVDESEDGMGGESEEAPKKELHTEEEAEEPVSEEGRGDDMEEDLELEAIIKELEEEMEGDEDPVAAEGRMNDEDEDPTDVHSEADDNMGDGTPDEGPAMEEGEEGEDVSIDEIIKALREDEGEESMEEMDSSEIGSGDNKVDDESGDYKNEVAEAYKVIRFLRSKINEVNLLNAKLLFSNKLFRNHSLNEGQKMKVIENFDRAQSLREVKLVFATLSESFNLGSRAKRTIKESYASKPSRSTRPAKKVISEGNDLASRWKKLANL
jgi:hypothetical protein